jgi:hypothetical protein
MSSRPVDRKRSVPVAGLVGEILDLAAGPCSDPFAGAATVDHTDGRGSSREIQVLVPPGFELLLLESEKESNTVCPRVLPCSA